MVRLIRRMLKTINHGDNKFQQVHRILILLTTEYPTSEQMDASWAEGTMAKTGIISSISGQSEATDPFITCIPITTNCLLFPFYVLNYLFAIPQYSCPPDPTPETWPRTWEGRSLTAPGSPRLESHPSARPESRPRRF